MNDPAGILRFARFALQLKRVKRQGWIDRGIEQPESSADHSWSVALLAWLLASGRPELDRQRVLLLGIVHDLPEALAGDSTPFDLHRDESGVIPSEYFKTAPAYTSEDDAEKREREEVALAEMLRDLPAGLKAEIRKAWQEYDDAETAEAQFVKQVDKLETVIQSEQYRSLQPDLVMDSFRYGARRDVSDPMLVALLGALLGEG